MKCRKHEATWHVTSWKVTCISSPEITFPATASSCVFKTESTLNYYPNCKSLTSILLPLTEFQSVSKSKFKQSGERSWIKADSKSCKRTIQTVVNLRSLCCALQLLLVTAVFFFFFHRMRTPVAAVIRGFFGFFFSSLTSSMSSADLWRPAEMLKQLKCPPFV